MTTQRAHKLAAREYMKQHPGTPYVVALKKVAQENTDWATYTYIGYDFTIGKNAPKPNAILVALPGEIPALAELSRERKTVTIFHPSDPFETLQVASARLGKKGNHRAVVFFEDINEFLKDSDGVSAVRELLVSGPGSNLWVIAGSSDTRKTVKALGKELVDQQVMLLTERRGIAYSPNTLLGYVNPLYTPEFGLKMQELFTPHEHVLYADEKGVLGSLQSEGVGHLDSFTVSDNPYEYILRTCSEAGLYLWEVSIYACDTSTGETVDAEYPLTELWPEVKRLKELNDYYQGQEPADCGVPHDMLTIAEEKELWDLVYTVLEKELQTEEAKFLLVYLDEDAIPFESALVLARPYLGKHKGWDRQTYNLAAYQWNKDHPDMPLHPEDRQKTNLHLAIVENLPEDWWTYQYDGKTYQLGNATSYPHILCAPSEGDIRDTAGITPTKGVETLYHPEEPEKTINQARAIYQARLNYLEKHDAYHYRELWGKHTLQNPVALAPILVLIDDVTALDEGTTESLQWLLRKVSHAGIYVVAGAPDKESAQKKLGISAANNCRTLTPRHTNQNLAGAYFFAFGVHGIIDTKTAEEYILKRKVVVFHDRNQWAHHLVHEYPNTLDPRWHITVDFTDLVHITEEGEIQTTDLHDLLSVTDDNYHASDASEVTNMRDKNGYSPLHDNAQYPAYLHLKEQESNRAEHRATINAALEDMYGTSDAALIPETLARLVPELADETAAALARPVLVQTSEGKEAYEAITMSYRRTLGVVSFAGYDAKVERFSLNPVEDEEPVVHPTAKDLKPFVVDPFAAFDKKKTLFVYAKDQVQRLRSEGLEGIFEDEVDEVFTADANFYDRVCESWGITGDKPTELSIYAYEEADPQGTLTEHKVTELWPAMARIEELFEHYFALSANSEEINKHIAASEAFNMVQQMQLSEKIIGVLQEVYGTDEARHLAVVGSDIFQLEFLALIARPYVGKVDGWDEETYRRAASLWNDSMSIPLHPED